MQNISDWDVIIVDDDEDNIGVLKLALEFHGANLRTATSAGECLKLLENKPNLLLLDIQMPAIDGFKLLEIIRSNHDWKDIPAIAVTARAMPEDKQHILDAGFDGYISKPISVMTFADEVRQILQK